jgi:hypothetical protein
MQRSLKARLSEREWESAHGLTTKVNNNNVRQESYQAYEQFCRSIGSEPASDLLYDLSISRISR